MIPSKNVGKACADGACVGGAYINRTYINRACIDGAYINRACTGGAYIDGACTDRACTGGAYADGAYANGAYNIIYSKSPACIPGNNRFVYIECPIRLEILLSLKEAKNPLVLI